MLAKTAFCLKSKELFCLSNKNYSVEKWRAVGKDEIKHEFAEGVLPSSDKREVLKWYIANTTVSEDKNIRAPTKQNLAQKCQC